MNSSIHKIQIPCKLPIGVSQLELAFQNGVSRFEKLFVHYWTLKGPIRRSCTYVQSSCASSHMVPLVRSIHFSLLVSFIIIFPQSFLLVPSHSFTIIHASSIIAASFHSAANVHNPVASFHSQQDCSHGIMFLKGPFIFIFSSI